MFGPEEEAKEEAYNRSALKKFQSLFQQIPAAHSFDSLRFFTTYKIGELQHYFENYPAAVRFYSAAIAAQKNTTLPDTLLFKPYLYSGIIYYNRNQFDSAIGFFKQAEALQRKTESRLQESERLFNVMGVLYYERGNYRQAENYFQKAIEVLDPEHESYRNLYVNYYINLAQIYLKLEEYDKANTIYQKLLPMQIMTNEIYHNIGSLNLSLGASEKALSYFRKVAPTYNKIIRLYNNMGNAFFAGKQYDSAFLYYQKARTKAETSGSNSDPVGYGQTLKSLGDYQVHLSRFDSALTYYQKALRLFYPLFTASDVHVNPEQYSGVFSYINLFQTLLAKANAWHSLYLQNGSLPAAQQELATYQSAFKLIEYVERTYESDEARLFLSKIKYTVHSKPIDIAFALYNQTKDKKYLEALYYLDQQNKATTLAVSRQINDELNAAHSPLLKEEQDIKASITRYSIRAAQVTDSAQLAELNQNIRDGEIRLSKVQDQLNQQSMIKETNIPSLSVLQSEVLEPSTALLSYHLSENRLTLLLITKDSVRCFQRELPARFYDEINDYINSLKDPLGKGLEKNRAAYYQLFFSGVPLQNLQELIIIPDDVLNYLPFESLQDNEGQYLVEKTAILYQYSAALLKREKSRFAGTETLSFAPFSGHALSDTFPQLANSLQEIKDLNGQHFFDTAATKSHFLQSCSSAKIIHLATHAVVNSRAENLSYIAFSPAEKDHLLYAQEIYNLPLRNTDLVILSACETSSGQLIKGEGVMSLSRAFRYAGCPNVITTLWKANDFSTAYLTTRIHSYLAKGYSIAKAVQQAKKDYLTDRTIHPRLKQPFYWSHLIFIGDVQESQSFSWRWFVLAGFLLIALLFLLWKKSRHAGHSLS